MLLPLPSIHIRRRLRRAVAWVFFGTVAGGFGLGLRAADGPVGGIVQKEIAKRNARVQDAKTLMTEGGMLYEKGEYAQAASDFRQAWELLPDSPMTAQLRL